MENIENTKVKIPEMLMQDDLGELLDILPKLHDMYATGRTLFASCPLCAFNTKMMNKYGEENLPDMSCAACPWTFFTGGSCEDWLKDGNAVALEPTFALVQRLDMGRLDLYVDEAKHTLLLKLAELRTESVQRITKWERMLKTYIENM
jgi:hypothetical protein